VLQEVFGYAHFIDHVTIIPTSYCWSREFYN